MKMSALLLCLVASTLYATEPTFIYMVRHAEKADGSADPLLSAKGEKRVDLLRDFFSEVDLKAVYVTQFKRTRHTGKPIAADHGLEATEINAFEPAKLVFALKEKKGGAVLVVGHSNTIPHLLMGLGGPEISLEESEYSDIFLVVLQDGRVFLQNFNLNPN